MGGKVMACELNEDSKKLQYKYCLIIKYDKEKMGQG